VDLSPCCSEEKAEGPGRPPPRQGSRSQLESSGWSVSEGICSQESTKTWVILTCIRKLWQHRILSRVFAYSQRRLPQDNLWPNSWLQSKQTLLAGTLPWWDSLMTTDIIQEQRNCLADVCCTPAVSFLSMFP